MTATNNPRKRCRHRTKSVGAACVKRLSTNTLRIRDEIQDDLTKVADFIWWRQKYSREAVAAANDVITEMKRQIAQREAAR